jgi:glycosyltransferase involved in cell wall biosynthesis
MGEETRSACVCTFRGGRFLDAQLASLARQTLTLTEVVVVDDGSDDDTLSIAERFARSAPFPVRVHRNLNRLGVARNFERALSLASGDILFLVDQDDVWHPEKVEKISRLLAMRPQLDLVFTDACLINAEGIATGDTLFASLGVGSRERNLVHTGRAFEILLRRNIVTGATVAVRRRGMQRAAPFPEGWIHDEWLAIVASATGAIEVIEEALIDYRQHGANQIGVERETMNTALAKLARSGLAYRHAVVTRVATLVGKLEALGASVRPEFLNAARAKLAHATTRASLPAARTLRLRLVARELVNGRYFRYSQGVRSAVADLSEPASV